MTINRAALRLAMAIHHQLAPRPDIQEVWTSPRDTWRHAERGVRDLRITLERGWTLAAQWCQQDLHALLEKLQSEISKVTRHLRSETTPTQRATPHEIYLDVLALQEAFAAIDWKIAEQTLSVATEPIELEGVYLGPFRIDLRWHNLGTNLSNRYSVVALDPQTAATDDDVTHPHVRHLTLREGQGQYAIRRALQQGRLLSFFRHVQCTLLTYDEQEALVSLTDWYRLNCPHCSGNTSEADAEICDDCGSTVCSACYTTCFCRWTYCSKCTSCCPGCSRQRCTNCMKTCSQCGAPVCRGCLVNERCAHCRTLDPAEAAHRR